MTQVTLVTSHELSRECHGPRHADCVASVCGIRAVSSEVIPHHNELTITMNISQFNQFSEYLYIINK